jgi:biopolymer transport protein ExbB
MLQLLTSKRVLAAALVACIACASSVATAQNPDDIMAKIRAERAVEQQTSRDREARARGDMEEQRKLNAKAQADKNTADARTKQLDSTYAVNEKKIRELNDLLKVNQGNLGELFGVTRQVAGDSLSELSSSLVSSQLITKPGEESRTDFLRRTSASAKLPNIKDLERMWYELLGEMKAGAEVVRYNAPVIPAKGGEAVDTEVVRVGRFMAYGDNKYLVYLPSKGKLSVLERQPVEGEMNLMSGTAAILKNTLGTGYMPAIVDPAGGALLSLYVERPNLLERIQNGEVVVYVIAALGIIGVLVAIFQYFYLVVAKMAVTAQLKSKAKPMQNNALGRMLLAVTGKDGHAADNELPEVVELRISEAVLKEIPKLERFQSFLRLAVAAGPLLGLIGTVIGMIITFQSITAAGTSDPKLMANGIGQAMIATVMGLGIAIPLLFINAGLVALSKTVVHVLEEESSDLLGKKLKQN